MTHIDMIIKQNNLCKSQPTWTNSKRLLSGLGRGRKFVKLGIFIYGIAMRMIYLQMVLGYRNRGIKNFGDNYIIMLCAFPKTRKN